MTLDASQARRRYLWLHALRWLPTGFLVPVLVLLMLERGLTLAQAGLVSAVTGVVVLVLELPTGGLSDTLGRRPVLLASCVASLGALFLLLVADTVVEFAAAAVLTGMFRALDSGPLEAWYVDAALAHDPDADIGTGLARGGVVLGLSISAGAVLAGGLVALDPLPDLDALAAPVLVALVLQAVALVATVLLLAETRASRGWTAVRTSVAAVPGTVREGLRSLASPVLAGLVAVEVTWGFGMVTFEQLLPVRLAEVVGDRDDAAALLGPVASAGWLVSAAGAAVVPRLSRRFGTVAAAASLRVAQGLTVAGMALAAGPVGVVSAFLATYAVHGASNPAHRTLLHRQVEAGRRNTVLSLNSMAAFGSFALGAVVLSALADATSVSTAILTGALVLSVGAVFYLPAHRQERRLVLSRRSGVVTTSVSLTGSLTRGPDHRSDEAP